MPWCLIQQCISLHGIVLSEAQEQLYLHFQVKMKLSEISCDHFLPNPYHGVVFWVVTHVELW